MHVLFVCLYMGTIAPLPHESKSVFAEFPGLVMRHKAIEVVCAHVKMHILMVVIFSKSNRLV